MTITEEQVYKEFFNNESISINVFYYDNKKYLMKVDSESLVEFLNKHVNNICDESLRNHVINIKDGTQSMISNIHRNNDYHFSYHYKQFCYNNLVVPTHSLPFGKEQLLELEKFDEYNIIKFLKIDCIENQIITLKTKYDKIINDLTKNLEDKLNIQNNKIRNLELEVHYLKSQTEKKVEIDYVIIKQKNKALNTEFKRVAKLMKLC